jgi:rhodanese-related sulfurtransferase
MRAHARRLAAGIGIAASAAIGAALGCDGGGWTSLHQVASFRSVDAAEGRALVARPNARLLQVGRAAGAASVLPGAELVELDADWPVDGKQAGPIVIVSSAPEAAMRLAARMARAGIQDVVVVDGGIEAWAQDPALAAADRATKRE